jgi:hypothetical protein
MVQPGMEKTIGMRRRNVPELPHLHIISKNMAAMQSTAFPNKKRRQ